MAARRRPGDHLSGGLNALRMTVWMRHRGHSWPRVADMAGAMFVPAIAAIALSWHGVIDSASILAVEHAAMLPAMVAVMLLQRDEYSRPAHAHLGR